MYTSITFLLAIAASVQAANNVPQKVTYTAAGASAVTGNGFGCAHSACPFPLPSFHHTKSNTLTTQSHPLDRVLSSAASSTFSQTASRLASPSESMHSKYNHLYERAISNGRIFSEATKKVTLCSIAGTSGPCGPAGVNVAVDLTGGTGTAPAASGPEGTTTLTAAELVNKPIRRRAADMWAEARSVEEELEDYE